MKKYLITLPLRRIRRKVFFARIAFILMIVSLCLIFFTSIKNDYFADLVQSTVKPLPPPTPGQQDLIVLLRDNPLSYNQDIEGKTSGFEHDLIEKLAKKLNVKTQYLLVDNENFDHFLKKEKYHIAISWLSVENIRDNTREMYISGKRSSYLRISKNRLSPPIIKSQDVLLQNEFTTPLKSLQQLEGKTIHVIAGTRQAKIAEQLQETIENLQVIEVKKGNELDLLEILANNDLPLHKNTNYVIADEYIDLMANHIFPNLRKTLIFNKNNLQNHNQEIVWILGKDFAFTDANADQNNQNADKNADKNETAKKNNQNLVENSWIDITQNFIKNLNENNYLAKVQEHHFGHLKRLTAVDIAAFLADIEKVLPRYRKFFHEAERISGLDWRLIAALSYQESRWNPTATSPTNVRGIMMLTEETADRLKVSNRLNARQSIKAGAKYLNYLRETFVDADEPNKTWLALAAYNTGLGGVLGARKLAKKHNADPNSWYEMKKILPLMARPGYAESVDSVRVRGGEAVILTENVRSYYGILQRYDDNMKTQNQENISPQNLLEATNNKNQNLLSINN